MSIAGRKYPLPLLSATLAALALIAAPPALARRAARHNALKVSPTVVLGPTVSGNAKQPPTSAQCQGVTGGLVLACYGPPDIQAQYDFGPLYAAGDKGAGQTIVIFDAFGSPTIAEDLASFDTAYGIQAPPSFNIYEPEGHVNYNWYPASPATAKNKNIAVKINWAYETTLDVEWSHAMAPDANIALVITPIPETEGVQGIPNLQNAQSWALANHIGNIWSDSWAATEQAFHSSAPIQNLDALYAKAASQGVNVFFSAGDSGAENVNKQNHPYSFATVNYPSSSPNVVSVGGTEIPSPPASITSYQTESVWNDFAGAGGGGFSTVFSEPAFQGDASITDPTGMRGVPDVSYNAALVSAILVWESFNPAGAGWTIIGGTSEGSPQWAGLDALANEADGSLGFLGPRLYQIYTNGSYAAAFHDITSGNNSFGGVTGYDAGTGWDPASGLGTPDASQLVMALASTTPTP